MGVSLREEYATCQRRVEAAGSQFALGMRLFPARGSDGIKALYAFFRATDDIVDATTPADSRRAELARWREQLDAALRGEPAEPSWLAAVADTAGRYQIPAGLLFGCIDTCAGDLVPVRLADWRQLDQYCDGVAGTVGEACLRLLGYDGPGCLELSRHNARGVQMTNILRDLDEDAGLDRVYIPREAAGGVELTPEMVLARPRDPALQAAIEAVAERAEANYRRAEPLFEQLRPADRLPMVALTLRYRRLLARLRTGAPRRSGDSLRVLVAAYASRWWPTWRG